LTNGLTFINNELKINDTPSAYKMPPLNKGHESKVSRLKSITGKSSNCCSIIKTNPRFIKKRIILYPLMFLPLLVNEKDILMPIKSAKPGAQIFDIHLVKNMGIEP
jgi:hypothetical protein